MFRVIAVAPAPIHSIAGRLNSQGLLEAKGLHAGYGETKVTCMALISRFAKAA